MAESDVTAAFLKVVESINAQLISVSDQVRDVRERLIRLESHGYADRLGKQEDEVDALRNRVTVLETRGQSVTAVISAGAAILTTAIATAVLHLFGK